MSPFKTYTARLVRADSLSELTKHLEFEVEGFARFGFVPGQWLSLKADSPDGELTRAYSIASAPSEDGRFSFCLNRVQDGFMSNYLCDLAVGAEITFQGPFGNFTLRPPLRDTVFIATGTGIAPFRSMLRALFESVPAAPPTNHFWLIQGARYEQDLYYRDEFPRLARAYSNFSYLPTLSRGESQWQGLRGYVQQHVPAIVGNRKDMHAYICGLEKMVSANRQLLAELGWDRASIRCEKYD